MTATRSARAAEGRVCSGVCRSRSASATGAAAPVGIGRPRRTERLGEHPRAHQTQQAGAEHDPREGNLEEEDRDEGSRRDRDLHGMAQRAAPDAQQRLEDEREHRGLDAEEDALHERKVAVGRVEEAQHEDRDEARAARRARPRRARRASGAAASPT